jgi:hypothetical protein
MKINWSLVFHSCDLKCFMQQPMIKLMLEESGFIGDSFFDYKRDFNGVDNEWRLN